MNLPTYNEYEQLVFDTFVKNRLSVVVKHDEERSDENYAAVAFRAPTTVHRLRKAAAHGWEVECRFKINKMRSIDPNPSVEGYFFIPKK